VAIVTDRDIVAHVVAEGRDPNSVTVDDTATHELVTIRPDQDVDGARQLMAQHELDRILVVEGDRLVVIISEGTSAPSRRLWPDNRRRLLWAGVLIGASICLMQCLSAVNLAVLR
jgi:CBS domain-containing protein